MTLATKPHVGRSCAQVALFLFFHFSFSLPITSFSDASLIMQSKHPTTLQTPRTCFFTIVYTPHTKVCFGELNNVLQDFFNFLLLRFSVIVLLSLSAVAGVVFSPWLSSFWPRSNFNHYIGQNPATAGIG